MSDLISREEMISQLEYCLANFTDYKEALEDTLRKVKGTRGVEPQERISPTVEPVSVAEAKKLLYQEFKDKMKDGNPRLLVAYEIAMKALETQTEWISVKDRLPDSAGVYIVSRWFSDGCDSAILTDACYFDGTDTWHNDNRINHGREYVNKKIVAWMPLPSPYKGE